MQSQTLAFKSATSNATRELSQQEFLYLYSTLIIFNTQYKLSLFRQHESLSGESLQALYDALKSTTNMLIETCYNLPDHQHISRYSTEYGNIIYRGKEVKVNYSTSPVGRLMVGLQYLLDFVQRLLQADDTLFIGPAPQYA